MGCCGCCDGVAEGRGVMGITTRPFSKGVMLSVGLPSIPTLGVLSLLSLLMCLASVRFQIENTIIPDIASTKQIPDTHFNRPTHDAAQLGGLRHSAFFSR